MKIIDCRNASSLTGKPTASRTIIDQVQSISHKVTDKEHFTNTLQKFLDNRFLWIDGAVLEDSLEPLPPILVGPTGMWLIHISPISGVYRASGENWEQMDEKSGAYRPAKLNPVLWAVDKARLVTGSLTLLQRQMPPVEPVVYFSAPDAHVELARPAARVVLADGVSRLINAILSAPVVLERATIQAISELLVPAILEAEQAPELPDSYSLQEEPAPKPPRTPTRLEEMARSEPELVGKISRKLPLTRKQWTWIGILIAANITILILLIIIISLNA